jgi:hypothetical protein
MSDAVPAWFGAVQHLSQLASAEWTHQDLHAPMDAMDVDHGQGPSQGPKEVVAALRARGAQDLETWGRNKPTLIKVLGLLDGANVFWRVLRDQLGVSEADLDGSVETWARLRWHFSQ